MAALVWAYIRPFTLPVEVDGETDRAGQELDREETADPIGEKTPASAEEGR